MFSPGGRQNKAPLIEYESSLRSAHDAHYSQETDKIAF